MNIKNFLIQLRKYLAFKLTQLYRNINNQENLDFGIITIIAVVFYVFYSPENELLKLLFYTPLILYKFKRKDSNFILKQFPFAKLLIISEYLLIFFLISLVYYFRFHEFSIYSGLICLLLLIPERIKLKGKFYHLNSVEIVNVDPKFIELKSYLNSRFNHFIINYIIILLLSFQFELILFSLIFWLNIIVNIFDKTEPKEVLIAFFTKSSLTEKIYSYIVVFLILSIPKILISLFMDYRILLLILLQSVYIVIFLGVSIMRKYAHINFQSTTTNFMFLYTLSLSLFIFPAVLLIISKYFRSAELNIIEYAGNK